LFASLGTLLVEKTGVANAEDVAVSYIMLFTAVISASRWIFAYTMLRPEHDERAQYEHEWRLLDAAGVARLGDDDDNDDDDDGTGAGAGAGHSPSQIEMQLVVDGDDDDVVDVDAGDRATAEASPPSLSLSRSQPPPSAATAAASAPPLSL